MTLAFVAVMVGIALLVWSADMFVDGAAVTARYAGLPALLVGMVVVGFGTSAPELAVSAQAATQGNAGLALGNAYGSSIANIGLILGATALLRPVVMQSALVRRELPLLCALTALAALPLMDGALSRLDALGLFGLFGGVMAWSIRSGLRTRNDALGEETAAAFGTHRMSRGQALFRLLAGLALLIASARLLVWGAEAIARGYGVSDLLIGLTVVAVGTSLPELASSLAAARKGEFDIALGNVLGSNLFNLLAVVAISGAIQPGGLPPELLSRDVWVLGAMTIALLWLTFAGGNPPRIGRRAGALLLAGYAGYVAWLAYGAVRVAGP